MESITIHWSGKEIKPVSWNSLYSQKHWAARSSMKNKWHTFFRSKFSKFPKIESDQFELIFKANSRHDIDNIGVMAKMCADTLVEMGWVPEDSPKHFMRLTQIVDKENLKSNSFSITYQPL